MFQAHDPSTPPSSGSPTPSPAPASGSPFGGASAAAMPSSALGNLITEYRAKKSQTRVSSVLGVIVFAATIVLIGVGILDSTPDTRYPVWIIAFFTFFFGLLMVWTESRAEALLTQVFDQGLIKRLGKKVETLKFDDIGTIFQTITKHYTNGIYTGTTHFYRVTRRDGSKIVFNDQLGKVEELGTTLQNEVGKRQYPQVMAALQRGESVNFGRFTLSKAGLTVGKDMIPWEQISETRIQRGFFYVQKQGKRFGGTNVSVSQIPNLVVFLTVIDQIVGLNTKK